MELSARLTSQQASASQMRMWDLGQARHLTSSLTLHPCAIYSQYFTGWLLRSEDKITVSSKVLHELKHPYGGSLASSCLFPSSLVRPFITLSLFLC